MTLPLADAHGSASNVKGQRTMKKIFHFGERAGRRVALFLLLGLWLNAAVASSRALAEECSGTITAEEALNAEDARYKAQTTNDFAAMERLFAQDLVYIHSTAATDHKSSNIEAMRSGTATYRAIRRSDVKVRTYGCLAIITGKAEVEVTVKGENRSIQLRFHSIWVKRAQSVQFVSWQSTQIPPAAKPQ
jgi:hypothetical protein